MNDDKVLTLLQESLRHVTNRPCRQLSAQDRMQDIGADSLELLELVAWAEQQLDLRIPDADLMTVSTVGDLCRLLAQPRSA
jgi:acyl carrier protein